MQDSASQKDQKERHRAASVVKCIQFLVHAIHCRDTSCKQPSCNKMKRVLSHTKECRLMLSGKWNMCTVCKHFILLCISHAKNCDQDKCPVPVCARIKKNLRDQKSLSSPPNKATPLAAGASRDNPSNNKPYISAPSPATGPVQASET